MDSKKEKSHFSNYKQSELNCLWKQLKPVNPAFRISAIYMIVGALWILLSDKIVETLISDRKLIVLISIFKGWFFVVVSSALVFFLVYKYLKHIKTSEQLIIEGYENTRKLNEELVAYQEKLQKVAYHDSLTGLFNRAKLYEDLNNSLTKNADIMKALIYIDMDNFKIINDTMGHFYGDRMISEMGQLLQNIDTGSHFVYRLGGDEFIIYIDEFFDKNEIKDYAEKLIKGIQGAIPAKGTMNYCTVSVGVALYPEDAGSPDELMKYADIAMYKAKAAGKNNYVFYNKNMQDAIQQRMLIGNYLRTALEKNEFALHYQAQLDIITGKITGFEALLRWNSAQLGVVPPGVFIGIAEETRQIISIGEWVLRESCRFLRELKDMGYSDLTISVNISVLQLLQNNYEDTVLEILHSYGINPLDLELEITESILVESFDDIVAKLNRLRQEGIRIAMDDFGKGYSSLSGLKQLPIDTLKIDKIFIDSIGTDGNESSITDSIVSMGRKLGKTVLAEGVETKRQMEYLTKHKCHKIQGYIISKPVSEEKVKELLINRG